MTTPPPYVYRGTPLEPGRWVSWWPDADHPGRVDGEVINSNPLLILIHQIHHSVPSDPLGRQPELGAVAQPWCGAVVEIGRPRDAVGLGAYVEYRPPTQAERYRRGPVVRVTDQGRMVEIRVVERGEGPWYAGERERDACRAPRADCYLATPPNPLAGKTLVLTGVFRERADVRTLERAGGRRGVGVTLKTDCVVLGDRTPKHGGRPLSKITAAKIDEATRLGIPVVTEQWLQARLRGCPCAAPEVGHDASCPLYIDPEERVRDLTDSVVEIRLSEGGEKRRRRPEQLAECLECVAPYDRRQERCVHDLAPRRSPRPETGDRAVWVSSADPTRWARGEVSAPASASCCFLKVSEASEPWRPMVGTLQLVSVRSLAVEHRAADLVGGLTRGECLVMWMENRLFAEGQGRPALPNQLTSDQIATARALWIEAESPRRSADLRRRIAAADLRVAAVVCIDYDLEMEVLGADVPDPLNHPPLGRADAEVPVP